MLASLPLRLAFCLALVPAAALAAPPAAPAPAAPAESGDATANPVEKPVRTLIAAVRYGKFPMAIKVLDGEGQGRLLLAADWPTATEAQRTEFIQLFHGVFAKIAFPKMQKNFEHLESIVYDAPEITGDTAKIKSTITILHALKKQELKLRYAMHKVGADWRIVDVAVLGDSMLTGVREDQIAPIMKEGGWPKLLDILRAKLKS